MNPSGPVFAPAHDVVFSGTVNFALSEKQFDELKAIVQLAELRDQISELKALVRQLAVSRPGAAAPDHDQAIASAVAATQQGAQQPRLGPYTNSELEAARAKYEPFLRGLFFEDLLARLPPSMHAPLGQVQLNLPAEMPAALGADPAFVLNVGAVPTSRQVFLPLRTAVWLDQYFGLIADLERRKCPDRFLIALVYAGMLTSSGQGGVRPPGPFAAFGLDDSIYRDAFVKDASNKLFGSTLFFLLAHELGHIARGHTAGVSGINSQLQEREADVYALDAMATVGLIPLNLALFFSAAAMMEGGQTSHPLSGSRVEAAARAIEARPRAFVRLQPNPSSWLPRILGLARQVRDAIPLADDPERRAEVLRVAGAADFTELRSVHERLCPQ